MICFIPISSLNSSIVTKHFFEVLQALKSVGFKVDLVLCDGHKINVKFFTELGSGFLEIYFMDPFESSKFIITLKGKSKCLTHIYNRVNNLNLAF